MVVIGISHGVSRADRGYDYDNDNRRADNDNEGDSEADKECPSIQRGTLKVRHNKQTGPLRP